MTTSLNRFQRVEGTSLIAPGCCAICSGSDQHSIFIDFGFTLDFYGAVYFCENCVKALANSLDYHSPTQWRIAQSELRDKTAELNNCMDRIEELENAVRVLRSLDNSTNVSNGIISESTASVPAEDEISSRTTGDENSRAERGTDPTVKLNGSDDSNVDGRKEGNSEQNAESGSSDIFDPDSIADLLADDI